MKEQPTPYSVNELLRILFLLHLRLLGSSTETPKISFPSVLHIHFYVNIVHFCMAVPKKEPDTESHQKEQQQQQSKLSATDKELNKEHLEAVKRYVWFVSYLYQQL
jgi:hypothetical protein